MEKNIIGEGAYGKIFKLNKQIAVKKINNDNTGIQIVEPIIMTGPYCTNVNFATSIKVKLDSIMIYQHLASKDLSAYLRNMKVLDIKKWTDQIINGLYHLHKHNIIHGDIKSQNILIFQDCLKIADFSLSHFCEFKNLSYKDFSSGDSEMVLCTYTHRPPELWLGKDYNHKIDIWSLGCLMYEMSFRTTLFKNKDDNIIEIKTFLKNKDIPDCAMKETILKCLNLDPSERPETFELLGLKDEFKEETRESFYCKLRKKVYSCVDGKNKDSLTDFITKKLMMFETENSMIQQEISFFKRKGFFLDVF